MKNTFDNREGFNPDVSQYGYIRRKSYDSREIQTKSNTASHKLERREARKLINELIAGIDDKRTTRAITRKILNNRYLKNRKGLTRRLKKGISEEDRDYLKILANQLKA